MRQEEFKVVYVYGDDLFYVLTNDGKYEYVSVPDIGFRLVELLEERKGK